MQGKETGRARQGRKKIGKANDRARKYDSRREGSMASLPHLILGQNRYWAYDKVQF